MCIRDRYMTQSWYINYLRFAWDNIYNFIVTIIMINIIAGIIIDTFKQLREELNEYEDDYNNICFICGHTRETLDKASDTKNGFVYHTKNDHCVWDYIFYIAYISEKDHTEYTGIESYVAEMIEKEDINWFPVYRALVIKSQEGEEEKDLIVSYLQKIDKNQERLLNCSKNLLNNIARFDEALKTRSRKQFSKQVSMSRSGINVPHPGQRSNNACLCNFFSLN
eukprot:TRINITY_DN7173_c0_g1_i12.p1 TRINITY_DN7173_c0_g1~~TRINITY_DN7173_c0_g1_i12.p1  ORF type:complete len:223 (+),score=55.36 TRINITY_DN7173_c0_g1_i12:65-733(+)